MGWLAGILYFDGRTPSAGDERAALGAFPIGTSAVIRRAPGLLMLCAETSDAASSDAGGLCTWDGNLHCRPADGFEGPASLLHLFETRGPQGLRDAIGDWSAVIWNAGARTLSLASDFAGIRPLYYRTAAEAAFWSSSLSHLVRWAGTGRLDSEYIQQFLTEGAAGCRTPYNEIMAAEPGAVLILSARGPRRERFWTMPAGPDLHYPNERDYEEQTCELFAGAVRWRLQNAAPVVAEFSGGLDSSSVVSMTNRLIAAALVPSRKLITLSYKYSGSADDPFIDEWNARNSGDSIVQNLDPQAVLSPADSGAPRLWGKRFHSTRRLMAETGAQVLLTGQLGDLVMGNWPNSAGLVADRLTRCEFPRAFREAFAWSRVENMPVYSILWAAMRQAVQRDGVLSGVSPAGPCDVPLSKRPLYRALGQLLGNRMLQCAEQLQDFSVTHPFAHRPLVEFLLQVPARVVYGPGEPRRLMRRAFRTLLPGFILKRRSKASFDRAYLMGFRPAAASLLRNPSAMRLVEMKYVDCGSVTSRLQRWIHGLGAADPQLRNVILLESWLQGELLPNDLR